jgi:pimeloyl-ACP methyl ester carboxylesterase
MAKANPRLSAAQAEHLARHGVRRHEDGYGWKFDPRVSMFAPEDFAVQGYPYWQKVTAPALILSGKLSWMGGDPVSDGRASAFETYRALSFEQAGHWIHHDQFDDFIAALDEFL